MTMFLAVILVMAVATPMLPVGPANAVVPEAPAAVGATTFSDVITKIPGLTHYYPLDAVNQARDVVGTVNGINHGATFGTNGATFNGSSYIELPDNDDFSAATTGAMTIVVFNTITNWKGAGASEYVHWMGKGVPGAHEWAFRHYVQGGTGEAATRQNRTSFYHFNASGGLGAGSYFQDPDGSTERMVTGTVDASNVTMWKNGVLRDTDSLAGYSITPANTTSPVRLGTRDMTTGFLVGRLRRVAFFDRTLSATELTTLYAAQGLPEGSGATTPAPAPTPTLDPVPDSDHVTIGAASRQLAGTDIDRAANALVRYTPARGANTGTNQYGAEATVVAGKVTAFVNRTSTGAPAAEIPANGYVLSGHGTARDWLVANAKIGSTLVSGPVTIGTASRPVTGTDIDREANALVRYTPARGTSTGTNQYGAEATVVAGKVTAFVNRTNTGTAAAKIPANGYVLSGHGTARDWLVANAKIGSTVKL